MFSLTNLIVFCKSKKQKNVTPVTHSQRFFCGRFHNWQLTGNWSLSRLSIKGASTKGLVFTSKDGLWFTTHVPNFMSELSVSSKSVSQCKIAKNLGLSRSTVHNIVKKFRKLRELLVRKGQGRKSLLIAHDNRALRR